MKRYQDNYAAGRPQMYDQESRQQKARRIIKTLETTLGGKRLKQLTLLDLGSSTGIIDNVLAPKFRLVVGTDIDKDAIKFANQSFKEKNLQFKVADAMKLNFPDNSFDVVICTHVYEHVPDASVLFKEIYRVLRPEGICYLAAQNRLWPWEPHYNLFFLSYFPKSVANIYLKIARRVEIYHETPFTYWGLKTLVRDFKVDEITQKILISPEKYGYDDVLQPDTLKSKIAYALNPFAKYFFPTFFWILKKDIS
jgi:ubiquinone/menaquinone biosynthesis C-methylase UbiE